MKRFGSRALVGIATTMSLVAIVAASVVGLHEWADGETTRGVDAAVSRDA
jgi:hypothetical protein